MIDSMLHIKKFEVQGFIYHTNSVLGIHCNDMGCMPKTDTLEPSLDI